MEKAKHILQVIPGLFKFLTIEWKWWNFFWRQLWTLKKIVRKRSQILKERTSSGVSFLVKRLRHWYFPVNFTKISEQLYYRIHVNRCFCITESALTFSVPLKIPYLKIMLFKMVGVLYVWSWKNTQKISVIISVKQGRHLRTMSPFKLIVNFWVNVKLPSLTK